MNRIKNLLMKDIVWKVLSLVIAICLWFVVINIENPTETRNYSPTIKFLNEDSVIFNGYVITNMEDIKDDSVKISLSGQRIVLDKVFQNRGSVEALVDLSKLPEDIEEGKAFLLPIDIKIPQFSEGRVTLESQSKEYIDVVVERYIDKSMPVIIDTVGTPMDGYTVTINALVPDEVIIMGARSAVDSVDYVGGQVAIDTVTSDGSVIVDIKAYDATGAQVQDVILSASDVNVELSVKKGKSIPLSVSSYGTPKEGYVVKEIIIDPAYIEVVGNDDVTSALEEISLPNVNIMDKDSDVVVEYTIKYFLPVNVRLKNETKDKVSVIVKIEEESGALIDIPIEDIGVEGDIDENLDYRIGTQKYSIEIRGLQEDIFAFNPMAGVATINISGLGEGSYTIEPTISLPDGIRAIGVGSIDVDIFSKDGLPVNTEAELPQEDLP